MDIRISIALKHDKSEADFCDENGAPLALICSAKNVSDAPYWIVDYTRLQEIYLPFIWAACKYYGIKEIVRLMICIERDKAPVEHEIKRVDPIRRKVLLGESCYNCGHFDENGCPLEWCKWTPRNGFIEKTDDESRCSECGCLVWTGSTSCPNCMARF